jgi:PHP family Zn ribbon phosphoesterase
MIDWKWNGARWWKFDFHTHTPASEEYGKGADQAALKARTPKEWLLDYMRAGIDCVAITDHNTGAWIDQIKQALADMETENHADFRPIHLFPGVEISVNGGIHLLAILGCEKSTSDIDSLLGAAGFTGTKGSSDAVTTKSFIEVVGAIVFAGGIAIPAHVEEDNGIYRQTGNTLQQIFDCAQVFAIELVNATFQKPQPYINKKLSWTEVLGSDAHHPSGNPGQKFPGSRFTWIKMGSPSLEGLQLAIMDGPLSVKRSDQTTDDPNRHASLVIESIEVSQARYIGRAQPFRLEMNP